MPFNRLSRSKDRRFWFARTSTLGWAALLSAFFLVVAAGSGATASVLSGSTHQPASSWQAAPAAIVAEVADVPITVLNTVEPYQIGVAQPIVLQSQPALTIDHKPGVYYVGAEPCPYCAAERWAFIVATSRFGKWSPLGISQSASDDVYPDTQTFTFARATFSSPYIAVEAEDFSNFKTDKEILERATPQEAKLFAGYNSAKYCHGAAGDYPFVDFGNGALVCANGFSPAVLAGMSRAQIASQLADPTSPSTKQIVAAANLQTAAICSIDGEQPTSVCTSEGVTQAKSAGKITPTFIGGCRPTVGVCAAPKQVRRISRFGASTKSSRPMDNSFRPAGPAPERRDGVPPCGTSGLGLLRPTNYISFDG